MSNLASISPAFAAKKSKILASLAVPADSYTDLSPKGSVDAGLIDLINEINALDGLVTTSSCAGRVSVFLEGDKSKSSDADQTAVPEPTNDEPVEDTDDHDLRIAKAVPGGKGLGGQWLFVSHSPVTLPPRKSGEMQHFDPDSLTHLFSLTPSGPDTNCGIAEDIFEAGEPLRLIRLQFEPMILHIQAASLQHAAPVLAAALNAGFRESGVQSLKALEDANAFPMVAVRTAGLGLSSVIGYAPSGAEFWGNRAWVGEEYLRMMVNLANERFGENTARIERFREELRRATGDNGKAKAEWEDAKVRADRMRSEGLKRRDEISRAQEGSGRSEEKDVVGDEGLGGNLFSGE